MHRPDTVIEISCKLFNDVFGGMLSKFIPNYLDRSD